MPDASVARLVIFLGSPTGPLGPMSAIQICELPSRVEMNASRLPSGDQRGVSSALSDRTIDTGSPPATGTSQMWLARLFFSRLTSVTT